MSLSKHNYTPSHDFPEEIWSEILKRLPVKYVLRCGAVQKSWFSLVRTRMFISLHSDYHKLTAHVNPKYLLFDNTSTHVMTVRSDDAHCEEYSTFVYSFDLPASSWYAQSNGLICVSTMFDKEFEFNHNIIIWNPLVQKFKTVPDSPLPRFSFQETKWIALCFGYLPEIKDYVLVHMVKLSLTCAPPGYPSDESYELYPHSVMISVYSLNGDSWKEMCQDKVFVDLMCTDESRFVNGTAFWVGYNFDKFYQVVMCFDTKTNVLRTVKVPNWIDINMRQSDDPRILPFGQSIAYFVEVDQEDADENDDDEYGAPHLDIGVLKDDMISGFSWQKKMSVGLGENVQAQVLGIRNNGEPILAKSNNLISYNLDTHEPYDFVQACDRLTPNYYYQEGSSSPYVISPFVETLLLLDTD